MIFKRKKTAMTKKRLRYLSNLRQEIEVSKRAILTAQNHFEHEVDPTLIDCYIFELNAAQLRYQFLIRSMKRQEVQEV